MCGLPMLRWIIAHHATLAEAYSFIHHVLFIMSYLYQKVCNHIRVLPLLEKSHGGHRKVKQKKKKKKKKE